MRSDQHLLINNKKNMSKELFIGDKKIRGTKVPQDETMIDVTFKDNTEITLKRKLYDIIVRDEKGNGNITESINTYLASKFICELASYGLEVGDITSIATAIGNLVHNFQESKISEKFNVPNIHRIKLSDIIE